VYKWQQEILNRMAQFKGKGLITMTGRGSGKSWNRDAVRRLIDDLGPYTLKTEVRQLHEEPYYVIQPVGWMNASENSQWSNMVGWCVETFGPTSDDGVWTPGQRWYVNNAKFWFKDVKDRDWFILRWS
jgi:hypothetical protein